MPRVNALLDLLVKTFGAIFVGLFARCFLEISIQLII